MASDSSAHPRGAYNLPHPAYAEEQPHARSILTTHVLYRGFQSGALIGGLIGAVLSPRVLPNGLPGSRLTSILRSSGRGSVYGVALTGLALTGRMWGRTEIEWQDRAWRLLENKGQISTDYWSAGGALAGAALAAASGGNGRGALFVLGGAGLGSLFGTVDSMGYRMATGTFQ